MIKKKHFEWWKENYKVWMCLLGVLLVAVGIGLCIYFLTQLNGDLAFICILGIALGLCIIHNYDSDLSYSTYEIEEICTVQDCSMIENAKIVYDKSGNTIKHTKTYHMVFINKNDVRYELITDEIEKYSDGVKSLRSDDEVLVTVKFSNNRKTNEIRSMRVVKFKKIDRKESEVCKVSLKK